MSIVDAFPGTAAPAKQQRPVRTGDPEAVEQAASETEVAEDDRQSWLASATHTVAADFRDSWLWDAEGITVRNLWEARIPQDVPGDSRALRLGWTVYNHAALVVLALLLFVAWVLCHPARLLYAAPVAAPLITLWLA